MDGALESLREGLRHCPTRPDGEVGLISQRITLPLCQERQRGLYHKCWTCAHLNPRATPERAPLNGAAGHGLNGKRATNGSNGHATASVNGLRLGERRAIEG